MVTRLQWFAADASARWLLAQQDQPLLPKDRVRVIAAMLLLVALCLGLIVFSVWAANWMRRHMSRTPSRSKQDAVKQVPADDWAGKPVDGDDDADKYP